MSAISWTHVSNGHVVVKGQKTNWLYAVHELLWKSIIADCQLEIFFRCFHVESPWDTLRKTIKILQWFWGFIIRYPQQLVHFGEKSPQVWTMRRLGTLPNFANRCDLMISRSFQLLFLCFNAPVFATCFYLLQSLPMEKSARATDFVSIRLQPAQLVLVPSIRHTYALRRFLLRILRICIEHTVNTSLDLDPCYILFCVVSFYRKHFDGLSY